MNKPQILFDKLGQGIVRCPPYEFVGNFNAALNHLGFFMLEVGELKERLSAKSAELAKAQADCAAWRHHAPRLLEALYHEKSDCYSTGPLHGGGTDYVCVACECLKNIDSLMKQTASGQPLLDQLAAKDALLAEMKTENDRLLEKYGSQTVQSEVREMLEAAGFGKPGTSNTLWGMVKAACERIAELEAVVAKLHKTKDGIPVTPDMKVFCPSGIECVFVDINEGLAFCECDDCGMTDPDTGCDTPSSLPISDCFSTCELAVSSRKEAK